ncbi:hypothetical protein NE865_07543 [Phthorimaea operculella]|nr:hypothetical protein NE865_07543 [Phthorimaea operculella]
MLEKDSRHDNEEGTEGGEKETVDLRVQIKGRLSQRNVSLSKLSLKSSRVANMSLSNARERSSVSRWRSRGLWWGALVALALLAAGVGGSEFPERECCDPVYPPNTATTAAAPVTVPVSKSATG